MNVLMFTFCVEFLTGVEAVWREVGHIWQQCKLWQTCHLGDVDGRQVFQVKQNNSKHHLKSKVFVARQLKVLEARLQNNPGVHGAPVLRLLHQVG